jgi:hypothetical protein
MAKLPGQEEQIRQVHAQFICQVVACCQNPDERPALDGLLKEAEGQGWGDLVQVIRRIVNGERDVSVLQGLDTEDTVIASAILQGLQDPKTLPNPNQQPDPTAAAPGLAQMIHAAGRGDVQALQAISMMAQQMTQAPGDMAKLGSQMKRLVDGERDPDILCQGMSHQGEQLMLSLLEELNKMGLQ